MDIPKKKHAANSLRTHTCAFLCSIDQFILNAEHYQNLKNVMGYKRKLLVVGEFYPSFYHLLICFNNLIN